MLTETAPAQQLDPPAEIEAPSGPQEAAPLTEAAETPATHVGVEDTDESEEAPALPGRHCMVRVKNIQPNPGNARDDAQALPGIVQNLHQDGVRGLLSPLIVVPLGPDEDGPYLIIDGEQRYWSAVEADQEWIPVIVREDLAANREQIISMLRQVHRTDLTATQQARAIEQLALDGMNDKDIAERTGYQPEQIRAGRQLATLDKRTAERTHTLGLDLTQVAALAEFADDPDRVETLLKEAEEGPFAFARAVEQHRGTRAAIAAEAARRAELVTAGVTLLAEHPRYNDPKIKEVSDLRDAEGNRVDAEAHSDCPGHAVRLFLAYDDRLRETNYCTDWRKYGHTLPAHAMTSTRSGPMTEEEKAERRRVIENNKAMEIANTVRREWLATFLTAKTPPKGTAKLIAEMLADSGYVLSTWINGGRKMLDDLLSPGKARRPGTKRVPARGVSDGRYSVISLAAIAAANESGITRSSWRAPDPTVGKWLQWCVANGFQVGEVEQLIIDATANHTKQRAGLSVVATPEPDELLIGDDADTIDSSSADGPDEGPTHAIRDDSDEPSGSELESTLAA
ncbi:ParB N-terminal domain-containing protein [Micromonospora sp. WMMD1155]|uniref:ParB/RepB/Spo0J family partition protein n=1 Tax=Micromonospora sp. WMMD1155 TaxID=3016094 RepID=UPI00249B3B72|nr:ParB N-terminal domain-containing protein [Micromonospora sp. WMMD1155]WFE53008.1 ParB N-terminal domain-containing protein [Micromonospora sp. WMMD1155]